MGLFLFSACLVFLLNSLSRLPLLLLLVILNVLIFLLLILLLQFPFTFLLCHFFFLLIFLCYSPFYILLFSYFFIFTCYSASFFHLVLHLFDRFGLQTSSKSTSFGLILRECRVCFTSAFLLIRPVTVHSVRQLISPSKSSHR